MEKAPEAAAKHDSKSDRTRQRILDAAAFSFRRHGFASVTLKDIAERAGMQAGSLYYHFESKEEIVEAVLAVGVENAFATTRAAVVALGSDIDPLARLRAAIAAHLRVMLAEGDYASANLRIFGQLPDAIRARHLKLQREYGAFWRTLFQDAADAGLIRVDLDLSVVRMLTLGALNWSVEWYQEGRRRSPSEIAAHAATIILDGLTPRPAPGRAGPVRVARIGSARRRPRKRS